MTYIPPRDRPADAEKVIDPVTGAKYLRRRTKAPHKKSTSGPLPATCTTPYCVDSGVPHDNCVVDQCQRMCYPSPYAPLHFPAISHPYYRQSSPLIPQDTYLPSADQQALQRWLQSFPHWRLPREMPPGWRPPAGSLPVQSRAYAQSIYIPDDIPTLPQGPVPTYTPYHHPQTMPSTPMTTLPHGTEFPNRYPDLMEWDNIQGGKLKWTPHPWVAHPLPHPDIPAQQFWGHTGDPDAGQQMWRGPGGWMPGSGTDTAGMHLITGGHPLPGMDPYWTPTRWAAPLYTPYPGISLSPWLAPNPRDANCPHLLWDAAVEPPNQIHRVTGRGMIADFASTDFFKAPATHPSATYFHVHLPGMRSSWGPVIVKKASGITVGDVFDAVWAYLQTPISYDDLSVIVASRGMRRYEKIKYALWRRCWSSAALYDYTASQGIKRVDLLEGNTVYWGVWLAYNPDGTWYLTMGFLPRTRAA